LIWVSLGIQFVGLVLDYPCHGLHPDVTPVTVREMVTHLSTVHLPLYVGVLSVLVTTAWGLVGHMRQSPIGIGLPVAFAGALIAAAGEGWHTYTHLQLSTHSGPSRGWVFGSNGTENRLKGRERALSVVGRDPKDS
jgi:hypothetical protein